MLYYYCCTKNVVVYFVLYYRTITVMNGMDTFIVVHEHSACGRGHSTRRVRNNEP